MTKFREFVLSGKFNEAYNLSKNMEKKLISDELIAISFSTKNMLAYGFAVYALLKEENDEYHDIAISLLMNSYIDLDGAAEFAYCHAKRELEYNDKSYSGLCNIRDLSSHPDNSGTKEDHEWAKNRINELYSDDIV